MPYRFLVLPYPRGVVLKRQRPHFRLSPVRHVSYPVLGVDCAVLLQAGLRILDTGYGVWRDVSRRGAME
jgi:hypothetical protein